MTDSPLSGIGPILGTGVTIVAGLGVIKATEDLMNKAKVKKKKVSKDKWTGNCADRVINNIL